MNGTADNQRLNNLETLFHPRSIAHVGASAKQVPGRFNFTNFMMQMNFTGDLFPVNPKYDAILGLKCYPNLATIPGTIDLVIMAIPAVLCSDILRDVPPGKINYVVIHTSGFGEINKTLLDEEILMLAEEKGFRVVGPNCMGIFSQKGRVGFWASHAEIVNPGNVGLISQSGGHGINTIENGIDTGVAFNKVISLGNQLDISIIEVLEYFSQDDTIGVIGIYMEQIADGRAFAEILRKTTLKKPVVIWKGGRTEAGQAAAATHTGSMAGNNEIFAAVMHQCGAVMADDMSEFINLIRLLQPGFGLPGSRFGIFSPGGGNTVNMSDLFSSRQHITIPRLPEETQARLARLLPEENVDVKNPVDIGAAAGHNLPAIFEIMATEPTISTVMLFLGVDFFLEFENEDTCATIAAAMADTMLSAFKPRQKPFYLLIQQQRKNNERIDRFRRMTANILIEKGIPWINAPFKETAVTMDKIVGYSKYLERWGSVTAAISGII